MVEKYSDLVEEIWRTDGGRTSLGSVEMVLDYLDTNPDQVPGRTITDSEFERATEGHTLGYAVGYGNALKAHGIDVIPDPEPTNVEKLRKVLDTFEVDEQNLDEVAELLDKAGVKAPGGSVD